MVPTGPQHHQPSCPPMLSAGVRTSPASRFADLLDRLAHLALVPGARDLRGHDDPDEPSALDHRQSADLTIGHFLFGIVHVLVRTDRDGIRRHDLADALRLRIHARGNAANDDVTIGDDADEATALDDRYRAAVLLFHE